MTLGFHGVILPAFHWAPPLWELPASELLSETFGHLLWMWVIEVIRRDLQQRWLPHTRPA
jgi:putative membrane protein